MFKSDITESIDIGASPENQSLTFIHLSAGILDAELFVSNCGSVANPAILDACIADGMFSFNVLSCFSQTSSLYGSFHP